MQDQDSLQFENNVEKIFERMFKNKLTGKAFAIRIVALMGIGFILSILVTTYLTTYLNSMAYSNNPISSSVSLFAPLMTIFTSISLIITASLVIRRVQDIVYDIAIWPYALSAVILSWIPFLGYIVLIALAILPSNYLTQEKQEQLLKKFA
jgi:uncharacterized membrane protein YhaH (DUF805 family)